MEQHLKSRNQMHIILKEQKEKSRSKQSVQRSKGNRFKERKDKNRN